MSSLTNNTTNRISSSSITNTNTTYPQLASSFDNTTNNNAINTTNDCTGSGSSPPSLSSTTANPLGLAAMGLAAASLATATNNSDNTECDSKQRHMSTPFKIHSNISDDPYASFYALNRTLPSPSSNPTGALPFNLINQSVNNNLPFTSHPTGSLFNPIKKHIHKIVSIN